MHVSPTPPAGRPAPATPRAPAAPVPPPDVPVDEVNLSGEAAAAGGPDPLRAARLAGIREQIAAGTYETGDKLDAALDRLLADLST